MTSKVMNEFNPTECGRLEQLATVCSIEVSARICGDSRFLNHMNTFVDC